MTEIALEGLKNLEIGKNKVKVSRAQAESALKNIADLKPKEASNAVFINNCKDRGFIFGKLRRNSKSRYPKNARYSSLRNNPQPSGLTFKHGHRRRSGRGGFLLAAKKRCGRGRLFLFRNARNTALFCRLKSRDRIWKRGWWDRVWGKSLLSLSS